MSEAGASIIAVDIGNSFAHLACFARETDDEQGLPQMQALEGGTAPRVLHLDGLHGLGKLQFDAAPHDWFISSVHRGREQTLVKWVAVQRPADRVRVLSARDYPLKIHVEQPERVGRDRLAAAVAANRLRAPEQAAIIVDAGTAITVDVVDQEGTLQGGASLPGIQMSARALHQQTDALPLVSIPRESPPVLGKHTEAAMQSGLFWGTVGAIRELVARLRAAWGLDADVLLTGGDAVPSALLQAVPGRFVPYLALYGTALTARSCLKESQA